MKNIVSTVAVSHQVFLSFCYQFKLNCESKFTGYRKVIKKIFQMVLSAAAAATDCKIKVISNSTKMKEDIGIPEVIC